MGRSLLVAGALLVAGGAAAAQVDTGPPRPPRVPPRPPTDSTAARAADSTGRDTLERFRPTFAMAIPPGPLPRGTRWTFDADSLVLSNITTLADLLAHLPGVYVARGGWFGAPEVAVYGGQGALGVEVYWDGAPYLALGRDSLWLDAARIPLAPVQRIDVQVLPSTLRVFLVTGSPRSTVPRSEVRIGTGMYSIAQYRGGFAKRWRSGVALSLAADYRNVDGISNSSTTAFNDIDLWLKGEYVPTPRFGVSYQLASSSWDRDAQSALVQAWKQQRRDGQLRLFYATRDDGLGARISLALVHAAAGGDTAAADRSLTQGLLELAQTWSRGSVGITARAQGEARPIQFDGHIGWQPVPFLTIAADGRRSYYGDRGHGNRAHVAVGVALPLGVSARGELTRLEDFQAPLVPTDTFQWATDYAGYLRWDRRRVALEVGSVRRDPFRPRGFAQGIQPVAALGPFPKSRYASVYLGVRPLSGVELSGWYFDPIDGGGDFEPPTHGRVSATFFSRFWRVYKSGVFALRGELAAESWSRSNLGGRDSTGAQIRLGPATFVETNIELRIADFTAYWMMRNYNGMRGSYVSGLGYPKHVQCYGVQWFFRN